MAEWLKRGEATGRTSGAKPGRGDRDDRCPGQTEIDACGNPSAIASLLRVASGTDGMILCGHAAWTMAPPFIVNVMRDDARERPV